MNVKVDAIFSNRASQRLHRWCTLLALWSSRSARDEGAMKSGAGRLMGVGGPARQKELSTSYRRLLLA